MIAQPACRLSSAAKPARNETIINKVIVKDLNGDGKPDIVFNPFNGTLDVMLNQGGGQFISGNLIDIGLLPVAMIASDLNHDGIPDLALIGLENCAQGIPNEFISVLSANGKPLATKHINYSSYNAWGLGLGDLNGDGYTDAVLSENGTSTKLTAMFNNGSGFFSLANHPYTDVADDSFALGNFNADSKADVAAIVTTTNELQVLLGLGNGEFHSSATYPTGSSPVSVSQVDLNGDGYRDLVVANSGDNTIEVFLGSADGKFQPGKSYAAGNSPTQVAFGDFNRDGKLDIAVANSTAVSILLGKGDGSFNALHSFPVGDTVNYIAVADLRGNGDNDVVVVVDDGNPYMYVLSGNGKGSLGKAVRYSGTDNAVGITTGDFNGDGAVDVAVQNFASTGPTIFYNQGGTHISLASSQKQIKSGQAVTLTAIVSASIAGSGMPTGVVDFRSGSILLGSATLQQGKATLSTSKLTPGMHSLVATYLGTQDFNHHVSSGITITVLP